MKKQSVVLLASAVVLAAGVAMFTRALLAPRVAPAPAASVEVKPSAEILVAAHALQPGDFIDASSLRWEKVEGRPSRGLFFVAGKDRLESLYGATLRQPLNPGDTLVPGQVVRQGEPGFIAAVLRPGLRAVSIPTSRVESNYGLVSSGDRVDVILGLKRNQENDEDKKDSTPFLAAETILHNVRVLALNDITHSESPVREIEEDEPAPSKDGKTNAAANRNNRAAPPKVAGSFQTVTLEVDPQQAQRLAVAKEIGTLQLALRPLRGQNEAEAEAEPETGVTRLAATTDIYSVPRTQSQTVTAFRGGKQEIISTAR
ncbi:MAG: hypothetical protein GAK45_00804 [Pseudomonas citronellolis]|nr:MAG: hypothetical protein GAK45_00804 [Pseudomonas citronellolis]